MKYHNIILILIIIVIIVNCSFAEEPLGSDISLEYAGSTMWSSKTDIQVVDNIVYVSSYYGIQVLDISDYADIKEVSKFQNGKSFTCIDIKDTLLFASIKNERLEIYNIKNPKNILFVGSCVTDCYILELTVVDSLAYLICPGSLEIISIKDPLTPVHIGSAEITYHQKVVARGIKVVGNYAYVASGDLCKIDVSNPYEPVMVHTLDVPESAEKLDIVDSLVFVACRSNCIPDRYSAVCVVNTSNPDSLELLSVFKCHGGVTDIYVQNGYAYVSAFINGITIFDISNPNEIYPVGCYSSIGEVSKFIPIGDVAIANTVKPTLIDYASTTDICSQYDSVAQTYHDPYQVLPDSGDLIIFDITDKSTPIPLGKYEHPGYSTKLTISDNYAFVSDMHSGVSIVDITSDSLNVLSRIRCDGSPNQCVVSDNLLLVAKEIAGLAIYDISDINEPSFVGEYRTNEEYGGAIKEFTPSVKVKDEYAYLTSSTEGLKIIDISQPQNLYEISTLKTKDFPCDIIINGDYCYIADRYTCLQVADISDSYHPILLDRNPDPTEHTWQIFLTKYNNILAAAGGSYIDIFDITDPAKPIKIGEYTSSYIQDIYLDGNFLFIAAFRQEFDIEIVDLSDPGNPKRVCYYSTSAASGVRYNNKNIYVADYYALMKLNMKLPTSVDGIIQEGSLPANYNLYQNYPNPFNPSTTISFSIPKSTWVSLNILNINGQLVKKLVNNYVSRGNYSLQWDGTSHNGDKVSSGVYFYNLKTDFFSEIRKMVMLK